MAASSPTRAPTRRVGLAMAAASCCAHRAKHLRTAGPTRRVPRAARRRPEGDSDRLPVAAKPPHDAARTELELVGGVGLGRSDELADALIAEERDVDERDLAVA